VSPKYAVISVGKGNDYGHPHTQTLDKLNAAGIQIYRTDISGTIIVTSDGKSITFDKKASPVKENAPPASDKPGVQTDQVIVKVTFPPIAMLSSRKNCCIYNKNWREIPYRRLQLSEEKQYPCKVVRCKKQRIYTLQQV